MNKVTATERSAILERAMEIVKLDAIGNIKEYPVYISNLMDEFEISHDRAEAAVNKAARRMRHASKSGTAPNTSLILTPAEIDWCNAHGGKSAAIHAALDAAMNVMSNT